MEEEGVVARGEAAGSLGAWWGGEVGDGVVGLEVIFVAGRGEAAVEDIGCEEDLGWWLEEAGDDVEAFCVV